MRDSAVEFNSFAFLYFLAVVFLLYAVLSHRWQNWLLLGASYFFYGYWDPRFLSLIVVSTLIDFFCAQKITATDNVRSRRVWLGVSVVVNFVILGFFKYFNFFTDSFSNLLVQFGVEVSPLRLELVLPVGISFYTFQTLSYSIDVYRRRVAPIWRIDDFALFVCFFPQLVAGPIERAASLLPQIAAKRHVDYEGLAQGVWLILLGFFKKVVVADNLAPYVMACRNDSASLSGGELAVGFYAMVIFLYADFSGYSNIARGVARLFGFEISQNFRMPLFASNPPDFWRRWHITLSDWFRDYCFKSMVSAVPGTSRRPALIAVFAFLTLVLCGLWHGAAWNFVAFGALHGVLLVGYYWVRPALRQRKVRAWLGQGTGYFLNRLVFFHLQSLPVVFFVIPHSYDWRHFFRGLLLGRYDGAALESLQTLLIFATPLLLIDLLQERKKDVFAVRGLNLTIRTLVYALLFSLIVLAGATSTHEFVYFQF